MYKLVKQPAKAKSAQNSADQACQNAIAIMASVLAVLRHLACPRRLKSIQLGIEA
jgi:hypothetical protein